MIVLVPTTFLIHILTQDTNRSHIPPQEGDFSTLNFQLMKLFETNVCTSSLINVLLLSDITVEGHPRLAIKRLKQLINVEE